MQNYVQKGDVLTLPAPYDVASGQAFLLGGLFAVATAAALSGALVEASLTGVYSLPKAGSQAWTVGAKVFWDAAAKVLTTTGTDNTLVGAAVASVDNAAGSTTGIVRLNGVAA